MAALLEGHTTLVTGAAGGVGRGIAIACARAGAQVVVTARDLAAAQAVVDEILANGRKAIAVACDVTEGGAAERAVAQAREHFGGLDSLVHNATSGRSPEPVAVEEATLSLWREHADVSLTGSYRCARAALPALRESATQGDAPPSLVLLTSPAGIEGSATLPLYSTVKAAQRTMVKSLAREWGPSGIRANAVCPQAATPAMVRAFEKNPTLEAHLAELTPLGRVGDAVDDVGDAVALLLSPQARYVTGQTWVIDGGRFLGL